MLFRDKVRGLARRHEERRHGEVSISFDALQRLQPQDAFTTP